MSNTLKMFIWQTCKPPSVKMRRKLKFVIAATQAVPRATTFTSSPSNLIDHCVCNTNPKSAHGNLHIHCSKTVKHWQGQVCACLKNYRRLKHEHFLEVNDHTSLLFAHVLNGQYIRVLMFFSPLQGFAKTRPFSFNAAIVKPKWSVIEGTRGPLPVSWKSICIQNHWTINT